MFRSRPRPIPWRRSSAQPESPPPTPQSGAVGAGEMRLRPHRALSPPPNRGGSGQHPRPRTPAGGHVLHEGGVRQTPARQAQTEPLLSGRGPSHPDSAGRRRPSRMRMPRWGASQTTARLVITGLPVEARPTLERTLATSMRAYRMCPDEWMTASGIDPWDTSARSRIEAFQLELTLDLLRTREEPRHRIGRVGGARSATPCAVPHDRSERQSSFSPRPVEPPPAHHASSVSSHGWRPRLRSPPAPGSGPPRPGTSRSACGRCCAYGSRRS